MTNSEKAIDKVSKLMQLANDPGASIGEIENALAMASKIMIKHNLSNGDIVLDSNEIAYDKIKIFTKSGEKQDWKWTLATTIAEFTMCSTFGNNIYKNGKCIGQDLTIIGSHLNRKIFYNMFLVSSNKYESLSSIRYSEYSKEMVSKYQNSNPSIKITQSLLLKKKLISSRVKFINSYYRGVNHGVYKKLKESTDTLDVNDSERYSLMIVKSNELIDKFTNDTFGEIRYEKGRHGELCSSGYEQGSKDSEIDQEVIQ